MAVSSPSTLGVESTFSPRVALLVGCSVAVVSRELPGNLAGVIDFRTGEAQLAMDSFTWLAEGFRVLFACILVAVNPGRSGMTWGAPHRVEHWRAMGVSLCVVATLLVPQAHLVNAKPPFVGFVLISPVFVQLVFSGYVFGLFNESFKRPAVAAVAAAGLLVGVIFVAELVFLHELPGPELLLRGTRITVVASMVWLRKRTGSIFYSLMGHAIVNGLIWWSPNINWMATGG